MVLKVKDYTWTQSEDSIFINVPLKGKSRKEIDIITTDSYVKVNFVPYIFECFLYEPVDDLTSKVVFIDGMLMFSLKKINLVEWPSLNNNFYEDKVSANNQRTIEIGKYEEKINKIDKEKSEKKNEGNKFSLKEMMQLESQDKERIKIIKEIETRKAMEELEEWKKSQISSVCADPLKNIERNVQLNFDMTKSSCEKSVIFANKQEIFDNNKSTSLYIEPIRKSGKINVSFTPRVFPTPERESVKQQENEWLQKQLDIKQQNRIKVTADMKPEQNNPEWLKNKGNSLFAAGDYGGALAAFSLALEINPELYEFYSNRAACHIKMRNFFKAVEDAAKALDLLNPPVAQNRLSRVKAHLRRGAAFCNLQMYREGLLDYEAALKLDPDNQSIINDISRIREI